MPFFSVARPSIQLGVLKSVLKANDYLVDDFYLNVDFAKNLDPNFYQEISYCGEYLLGEWLFSEDCFSLDVDFNYIDLVERDLNKMLPDSFGNFDVRKKLSEIRKVIVPSWLDSLTKRIPWQEYMAVGFSCTFSQTIPSLALAKRLRAKLPDLKILMGGSAFEGEMGVELASNVDWIDTIVQGEGETAILELCSLIQNSKDLPKIYKSHKMTVLNAIPFPDYDSFFFQPRETPSHKNVLLNAPIVFEASRGCWWGQKHHCVFCGLNGETMTFREKSADRVLEEMNHLSKRYSRNDFFAVDNILSSKSYDSLLPSLSSKKLKYNIFFEIKANITFKKLKLLKDSGVSNVQPGIESLDTEILQIIKKGVNSAQNVELLVWARELGVRCTWNLIYGFPLEREESYRNIISLIPSLYHLEPPGHCGPVRVDRFSPLFERYRKEKSEYGKSLVFEKLIPSKVYDYCFPDSFNYERLAYFFLSQLKEPLKCQVYEELVNAVNKWQSLWSKSDAAPKLVLVVNDDIGTVLDTRFNSQGDVYRLQGIYLKIALCLLRCGKTLNSIACEINAMPEIVAPILDEFVSSKLCVKLDGKYIWLGISNL